MDWTKQIIRYAVVMVLRYFSSTNFNCWAYAIPTSIYSA